MQADLSGCRPTLECSAELSSGQNVGDSSSADSRGSRTPPLAPGPAPTNPGLGPGSGHALSSCCWGRGNGCMQRHCCRIRLLHIRTMVYCQNWIWLLPVGWRVVFMRASQSNSFYSQANGIFLAYYVSARALSSTRFHVEAILCSWVTPHLSLDTELSRNRFFKICCQGLFGVGSCFCFDLRV